MTGQTAGKAHVFGDDINTDVLAPGIYMKSPLEELARHCLETVDPGFAASVATGDLLVAGKNLGVGSSREQAVQALQYLGIRVLVAQSFAGIFYRNALNFGLVAVACAEADRIAAGDRLHVDAALGQITNLTTGAVYPCETLPDQLLAMVRDGGLVAHLQKTRAKHD